MAVDHIRYDILTQEALRGVVRTVLADAAKNGLPGDHHFFISFDTRADGVRLSPRMLAQYPAEMTVVMQHQFWDLTVTEDGFEVGVAFGGIPERLTIPFAAIKGFFDPSVDFGLKFAEMSEATGTEEAEETSPAGKGLNTNRPPAERKGRPPTAATVPTPANPEPAKSGAAKTDSAKPGAAKPGAAKSGAAKSEPAKTASGTDPDKPTSGGEVVRLDRFRKK